METKLQALQLAISEGDWKTAIRLAAKFPHLGAERDLILDAHLAFTNPRFCICLHKVPEQLIEQGIAALRLQHSI